MNNEQLIEALATKAVENLTQNMRNGALVLDGKGEFPKDCAEKLDLIIDHTTKINPIEGLPPEILAAILQARNTPSGGDAGNSKHFSESAKNGILNAAILLEAFAKNNLAKYNLSGLRSVLNSMFSSSEEEADALLQIIDAVHFNDRSEDLFIDAMTYYMEISTKEGEEKNSIKSTINAWLAPFFQSKELRHMCDVVNSDVDIKDILHGKRYGLLLPKSKFPIAGPVLASILKKKLYMAIEERGDKWRDKGMSQVFLIIDEAQEVADDADLTIIPMARSWGLTVAFSTQNIESYIAKHNKERAMQMMDSLGSIICMRSSAQTYDYIRERIGKDRVWTETIQTNSLAYGLTNKLTMANPVFDPSNPDRGWMKFFSGGIVKKLMGRLGVGQLSKGGDKFNKYASLTLSEQPTHILQDKDIQIVQTEAFTAIAILQRGNAPRRDIIRTMPLDDKFQPIATDPETMLAKAEVNYGDIL